MGGSGSFDYSVSLGPFFWLWNFNFEFVLDWKLDLDLIQDMTWTWTWSLTKIQIPRPSGFSASIDQNEDGDTDTDISSISGSQFYLGTSCTFEKYWSFQSQNQVEILSHMSQSQPQRRTVDRRSRICISTFTEIFLLQMFFQMSLQTEKKQNISCQDWPRPPQIHL